MYRFIVSFRLHKRSEDDTEYYMERYDKIKKYILDIGIEIWTETTSFFAFKTLKGITDIKIGLLDCVNMEIDYVLIYQVDTKYYAEIGKEIHGMRIGRILDTSVRV